ncbi:butyrate kinase [Desertibacillus haloalkaliphilus]|uniref:butyrate kinase n=1 Tax=Desertibacillus haloalkaliphilus TaxID=1328930 RepID=UPI001C27C183|nr:butyrate kinase [Desertibacillus haloalkaliphilus]
MNNQYKILAINPGSTSTKLALYEGDQEIFRTSIKHDENDLNTFANVIKQKDYRKKEVLHAIQSNGISCADLSAVVGRGGMLKSLKSGTYLINKQMIDDLECSRFGEHASNLGAIIAAEIGDNHDIPAYIVDPVVVDELSDIARLSGIPEVERQSQLHALNIKAVSRKASRYFNKPRESLHFVIVHLGSGISIAAERGGKIIDVNNANNEGPFSPERTGTLPAKQLVKLCFSGKYTEDELLDRITKTGGLYAYLGTKNFTEIEEQMNRGHKQATFVVNGMIYQIAKEIGAMSTVLGGEVDAILLTGGITFSDYVVNELISRVQFLAPIYSFPGEEELEALALGALRVLLEQEPVNRYE